MMSGTKPKLFLIFHGRFPSEKAAALFAAKSAASFADLGLSVTLLVPRRLGRSPKSAFDFYGLPKNFKVVYLPVLDLFRLPFFKHLAFYASFLSFSIFLFFYLLFRASRSDIIYSNESLPLLLASFIFPKTAYEVHDFPNKNLFYRALFSRVRVVISTNQWKKEKLQKIFSVSEHKIFVEQNTVDLDRFKNAMDRDEARRKLELPPVIPIIAYVGQLRTMGMEKGIEILLKAVKSVAGCKLLVVGGSPEDVEFYKKVAGDYGIIDRVIFTGFVPQREVPFYLAAADVLVAPFPKSDHYEFYMSPMKIFEYMASGKPIVTSDLTSIREILSDDAAIFVLPDDASALAAGIIDALENKADASRRSAKALETIHKHSWEKRAERILNFIR